MKDIKQEKTPLLTKLLEYSNSNVIPFDVPGHRMGATDSILRKTLGEKVMRLDVNAPKGLDNLASPRGVIKQAQELMAQLWGADEAFFLVNGSTVGIIGMILATVKDGQKILMPRNVHKSAINALIISGAIPVFIEPDIDDEIGIANGISYEKVSQAINNNPDCKAILIINPTYFGVVSDLSNIIKLCHENQIVVLVDEAHGTHFNFLKQFPITAMNAGADMATCSIHKTSGSLTQTSCLFLKGDRVKKSKIQSTLNMLQSTSPSYLLLASLDATRKQLYLEGEKIFQNCINLANFARQEINKIPGLRILDQDYFALRGFSKYDHTKLVIKVNDLGYSGFEIYKMLKEEYNIQPELAESYVVLFIIGSGIEEKSIKRLIKALSSISKRFYGKKEIFKALLPNISYPKLMMSPRKAFNSEMKYVDLLESVGKISGESVMIYPPGIPLVIPGEVITQQVIKLFKFYEEQESVTLNDSAKGFIKVVDEEQ